jgi:hypothetical protein
LNALGGGPISLDARLFCAGSSNFVIRSCGCGFEGLRTS